MRISKKDIAGNYRTLELSKQFPFIKYTDHIGLYLFTDLNPIEKKKIAIEIVEVFETLLDKHDIVIPADERIKGDNRPCLIGYDWGETVDLIDDILEKENKT